MFHRYLAPRVLLLSILISLNNEFYSTDQPSIWRSGKSFVCFLSHDDTGG